ncbi:transmembrane protein 185B-like [Dysidea avara]|uniref:transmembrane protein 185B-like n=1 Tax=Dysidea avara TaxID=196820 RepID=UPI0033182727
MHIKDFLQNFNASNFVVYVCLLIFSLLLSLRLDEIITWNYGAVFFSIWLWNAIWIAGLIVGIITFIRKRELREDEDQRIHFKAIIVSSILQGILFLQEILIVVNVESGKHEWRAIFTPAYFLCLLCIFACIWSCWRRRGVELELLGILNILQLVFLGIRLDELVEWTWAVVLIPTWILIVVFFVGLPVYGLVLVALHVTADNPQEIKKRRLPDLGVIVCGSIVAVCVTVFLSLLVRTLDDHNDIDFTTVFIPLHIALLALMVSTVTRHPGNPLWFGIRKDFYDLAVENIPILQEYFNISYNYPDEQPVLEGGKVNIEHKHKHRGKKLKAPIGHIENLDVPD